MSGSYYAADWLLQHQQLLLLSSSPPPDDEHPYFAIHYLPIAWLIVYATYKLVYGAVRKVRGGQVTRLGFFAPFIEEDDVLACAASQQPAEEPHEQPPVHDTRLDWQLPIFTLAEVTGWIAWTAREVLYEKAKERASWRDMLRFMWTAPRLRESTIYSISWAAAFSRAVTLNPTRPSTGLLVLLILLLSSSVADVAETLHALSSSHRPFSWRSIARLPDLAISSSLIYTMITAPLERKLPPVFPKHEGRFRDIDRQSSPEDANTMLGALTYSWISPIMTLARQRPLLPEDVWSLSLSNRAEVLSRKFAMLMDESLLMRILRANSLDIMCDFALKLVAVTFNFARPYFIRRILEELTLAATLDSDTTAAEWTPIEKAYVYGLLAFAAVVARCLIEQRHYHLARRIGMRSRSELTVAIFEKALVRKDMGGRVSAKASVAEKDSQDVNASVGKVMNLVSDDVNRVLRMGCDGHCLYGAPLEIALGLLSLYDLMGWSGFVGFAVLAIAVPINWWLGKRAIRVARGRSAARDDRQASVDELISSIQTIKFFGWSSAWIDKVLALRQRELKWMVNEWMNGFYFSLLWNLVSLVVPLAAFFCRVKFQQLELTVAIAFTALALFTMIRAPMNLIPEYGIKILEFLVSVRRIEAFLHEEDVEGHALKENRSMSGSRMAYEKATLRWHCETGDEALAWQLEDINLEFKPGLTVINGPTGSGKSSLLLGLLGELEIISGSVQLPVGVSYAAQHPWLESTSIRENILLGHPFNRARYNAVLEACALVSDLASLPMGDRSFVGERGVSLSGGQRARVSLARAIYAPGKHVLLDDVLAAVDSSTAKHLVERLLKGDLLRDRTCVLVTHHVSMVASATTYLVTLEGGRIAYQGTPESRRPLPAEAIITEGVGEETLPDLLLEEHNDEKERDIAAVSVEKWSTGEVNLSMYHTYLSAGSYLLWALNLVSIVAIYGLAFAEQFWLRLWSEASIGGKPVNVNRFLVGYALIGLATTIVFVISLFIGYWTSLRASTRLFDRLLHQVIHATLRWFDLVPKGRITNRFTNDIAVVDQSLTNDFRSFVSNFSGMILSLAITSAILPAAFVPVLAFATIYLAIFVRYLGVNRDLNRIQATSSSPLFSSFQEALVGITTIRAFGKEADFRADLCAIIDATLALWYASCTLDIYLNIRSQFLSGGCLLVTAWLSTYTRISPGLAGIAITSCMSIISAFDRLCLSYGGVVRGLNSLERITEYLGLPQEPKDGLQPPATWPSASNKQAIVEVQDLVIRYSPELPEVLKGVSFTLKAGERVAIAGRTGSGKTTLATSLLRFIDAYSGSIRIDNMDITLLDLEVLRRRVTLLPQDAVLFSGTVRQNLDPMDEHSDEECWDALRRVHLHSVDDFATPLGAQTPITPGVTTPLAVSPFFVSTKKPRIGLETVVSTGGGNLSSGQRQLVALARALLRNSRIIIFDESTASIDMELDRRIQETIRAEFADATLITIAHRLRTIADFDRVMVLEAGAIVEFDSPIRLLADDSSAFHKLCLESGDYEEIKQIALARRPE